MCQSSKFAINMYVYRVTEKYLNPLSSRNVLHHNIYKIGSEHSHVLQEARFVSFCAGETDDVKACEFLLSQHRGLKLTETLCSSYEQRTQQK